MNCDRLKINRSFLTISLPSVEPLIQIKCVNGTGFFYSWSRWSSGWRLYKYVILEEHICTTCRCQDCKEFEVLLK